MQTHFPPRIFLAATLRWPTAARLAIAFTKMGCSVDAICPWQHPVAKTRAIRKIYPYAVFKPLTALRSAILTAKPDIIIPCDDQAALHLYQLYQQTDEEEPSGKELRLLIHRSLGVPEACAFATARGQLMALAAAEGIRVPLTSIVATASELKLWLSQHGFPAVIKIDQSWGGQGVSIVYHQKEALCSFDAFTSRLSIGKAIKHALLERDFSYILNFLPTPRRNVTVQKYIVGTPANRAVACWQGRVLAGMSVEAIKTQHATGPATVVRVIENAEMTQAANQMVRRLGVSGLWGMDFILEAATGAAYLIEINPRATPICHLPLNMGRNLLLALYTQVAGGEPSKLPTEIRDGVIAMFPGEWHRNLSSSYLSSIYQDIPWDEPEFFKDCIDIPWSERGLLTRIFAKMRPKSSRQSPEKNQLSKVNLGVEDKLY